MKLSLGMLVIGNTAKVL